ncbi:hypothetical protein BJ742DRAFT_824573 [Cladochytrium replicatum]|nr:hypothetical protein BJ742DRAFT_824573 [Cladochytrium replicatum]
MCVLWLGGASRASAIFVGPIRCNAMVNVSLNSLELETSNTRTSFRSSCSKPGTLHNSLFLVHHHRGLKRTHERIREVLVEIKVSGETLDHWIDFQQFIFQILAESVLAKLLNAASSP